MTPDQFSAAVWALMGLGFACGFLGRLSAEFVEVVALHCWRSLRRRARAWGRYQWGRA